MTIVDHLIDIAFFHGHVFQPGSYVALDVDRLLLGSIRRLEPVELNKNMRKLSDAKRVMFDNTLLSESQIGFGRWAAAHEQTKFIRNSYLLQSFLHTGR